MKRIPLLTAMFMLVAPAPVVQAAITAVTLHGVGSNDLDGLLAGKDALSGLIATELPGDLGWHPANTNPADQLPVFTNDSGENGLAGLLNDFPGVGTPTKRIQYDLAAPADLRRIQILSGNDGADGRIYSTYRIFASTDGGANFSPLGGWVPTLGANPNGYYQSDPSGSLNPGLLRSTLQTVFDDGGAPLATGVTNLQFEFFTVDNTGGQSRDPFDGVNPYTNVDDGFSAAFVAPLIWEIDAIVPEPTSVLLTVVGLLGLIVEGRRR